MQYQGILHRRFFQVFLSVLLLFSSCAPTKFLIDKKPLYGYFETNPVFRESHTGLMVYDLEEKSSVFEYNAQKHFTPASNTKLLTYLAITKTLEDHIPSLEYCEGNDTLYFTGTGDPTFLYSSVDQGETIDFLKSHLNKLGYTEKPMKGQRFGPGWSWDDYPYSYSAEKSSFPIYGNVVTFRKDSLNNLLKIIPNYFEDNVSVIQDQSLPSYQVHRNEFDNAFMLKFHGKSIQIDDEIPFIYSSGLFIKLLSDTLNRPVYLVNKFPGCPVKTRFSVPTDSVSKKILSDSDNFLAEQMLLVISNQFGDTLDSKKTIDFMMKNHLSELENEIYWVDGSGLSRYNQVTPHAIVLILEELFNRIPKNRLFTLLPESGNTGTLKTSFPELTGKIHAKTGSMSHVYNLSGFLETKSGKILLFSFMNNNFNVSFNELKMEMERVLSVFVNEY